jgi:hypothetical protein
MNRQPVEVAAEAHGCVMLSLPKHGHDQGKEAEEKRGAALLRRLARFDVSAGLILGQPTTAKTASQQVLTCHGWSARESNPEPIGVSAHRQEGSSPRAATVVLSLSRITAAPGAFRWDEFAMRKTNRFGTGLRM